jgi:hypothetical protein
VNALTVIKDMTGTLMQRSTSEMKACGYWTQEVGLLL